MGISILAMTRSIVLLMALVFIFFNRSRMPGAYILVVLLLFLLALPGVLYSVTTTTSNYARFYEVKELAKVLYGPVLILLFTLLLTKSWVSVAGVLKYIEFTAYFVGACLLAMQLGGLGFSEEQGLWAKGFFSAQNDISHALVLCFAVAVFRNMMLPGPVRFACLCITAAALFLIGQRVALVGLALTPLLIFVSMIFARSGDWKGHIKSLRLSRAAMLLATVIVLGLVYFFAYPQSLQRPLEKFEANLAGYGQRVELYKIGLDQLEKRSTAAKLIGEGASSYQSWNYKRYGLKQGSGYRMVEMDWIDLYGAYGIGFVALVYGLLITFIGMAGYLFTRYRIPEAGLLFITLGIYTLHSVIVGHALTAPMPSTIMAAGIAIMLQLRRTMNEKIDAECG